MSRPPVLLDTLQHQSAAKFGAINHSPWQRPVLAWVLMHGANESGWFIYLALPSTPEGS
jgi:hypothetical protein